MNPLAISGGLALGLVIGIIGSGGGTFLTLALLSSKAFIVTNTLCAIQTSIHQPGRGVECHTPPSPS